MYFLYISGFLLIEKFINAIQLLKQQKLVHLEKISVVLAGFWRICFGRLLKINRYPVFFSFKYSSLELQKANSGRLILLKLSPVASRSLLGYNKELFHDLHKWKFPAGFFFKKTKFLERALYLNYFSWKQYLWLCRLHHRLCEFWKPCCFFTEAVHFDSVILL